jgi:hypothetical protein
MTAPEAAFTSLALEAFGDRDRAIEALRRVQAPGVEFAMALRDPLFDQMRSDARFRRIAQAATRSSPAESESPRDSDGTRQAGSSPR